MLSLTEGSPIALICEKGKKDRPIFLNHDENYYNGVETEGGMREIKINKGRIQMLPNTKTRDSVYISGPSGSGKSTWAGDYVFEFKRLFKDTKRVVVISQIDSDESFKDLGAEKIDVNDELLNDPLTIDDLDGSLVIFDDIDTIPNKKIRNDILALQNEILQTGRHRDIYVISTTHQLKNWRQTMLLIMEAHLVVLFPKSGASQQVNGFLKDNLGCDKATIQKIMKLPGRWVAIHTRCPQYVAYDKGLFML